MTNEKKDKKRKAKSKQNEKTIERPIEKEIEQRHEDEPEQLSAEPYIDYHKPYTIEIEKDTEEPLPRLPAPIGFH